MGLAAFQIEGRELPWRSSSKNSNETPWSTQGSGELKERRENFIRALEPKKSIESEQPRIDHPGTLHEDSREIQNLPWKRFESEAGKSQFGKSPRFKVDKPKTIPYYNILS